jgi:hypothetical protein
MRDAPSPGPGPGPGRGCGRGSGLAFCSVREIVSEMVSDVVMAVIDVLTVKIVIDMTHIQSMMMCRGREGRFLLMVYVYMCMCICVCGGDTVENVYRNVGRKRRERMTRKFFFLWL